MSYWSDRQAQLYAQLEKDEALLKARLSRYYDKEAARLEKEIAAFYRRYGEDNVLTYRNVVESLSDADVRLLMERKEAFAVKYPQYAELIPIREDIYKLNRLEGLQESIHMQQLEIGAWNNEQMENYLKKQAARGVNAAAETMGFGKNFYGVNSAVVGQIVNTVWANGKNFSQRIWGNTDKLADYLTTDMAQAIARGDSYDNIVRAMQARFGKVSRNDMFRLVYTEGTFVMAESTMQPFVEDFETYKVSTAYDNKVCDVCADISKQTFNIADREPGVNFPALHAWCRCTFEIVVDDWDKWLDDYEKRHGNNGEDVAKELKTKSENDRIKQDDILIHRSVGAAAKNYDVLLPNGKYTKLAEGTKITKVYTFAGKGTKTRLRVAGRLAKQYKVPATEWKKVRGDGYVVVDGKNRHAELHWYEANKVGRIELKVKRWFDEG